MPIDDTTWIDITPGTPDVFVAEFVQPFDTTGPGFAQARTRRNNGCFEFMFWAVWGTSAPWLPGTGTLHATLDGRIGQESPPKMVVPAVAYDSSVDRYYAGVAIVSPYVGGVALNFAFGTNAQLASETIPFTWAQGDWLIAGTAIQAFDN